MRLGTLCTVSGCFRLMQASCAGHCQHCDALSCAIFSAGQLHRRCATDEGLGGLSGCQESGGGAIPFLMVVVLLLM
jgi:hypothetical protein